MSSSRQGYLRNLRITPGLLRRGMNLWPPFVGAGIKVLHIAPDYREAKVQLRLGMLNRNYFGTHFGGSLFAMTDPFFALLMVHNLGRDYIVWDKASRIEYLKPARGTVSAHFRLEATDVEAARAATADGEKYEPTFSVDVVDRLGEVVCRVDKTLYVRRKQGR
jgi:acyl-coenzyme A thioesterase PaaI-like protein